MAKKPATAARNKLIYCFGKSKCDGKGDMKALLGGKGANLCEMTQIGLNVPPGFVITTDACMEFLESGKLPSALMDEVGHNIQSLEVQTGRRFGAAANGVRINDPNASVSDGQGGVYFSDSGVFSARAPATGRVYHVTAMGVMTEVVSGIKYANGVQFDPATRTLYVSEHLARRILALTLDSRQRVTATKVFADFAQIPATKSHTYEEAGPDGLILRPGYLVVAEYGEGRVHVFTREGVWRTTLKVSMPFVDTVAFDGAGNLWAGGSFQNTRPPFEGAVVRFPQSEWEQPAR